MALDKAEVVAALRAHLEARRDRMLESARATESAATDPENKAENKYDTRGLEASYLAAGQAEQVETLQAALESLKDAAFPDFGDDDAIAAGALVEVELAGDMEIFLLTPAAGGETIEIGDLDVTTLAPGAPLRNSLTGMYRGQQLERPALRVLRLS